MCYNVHLPFPGAHKACNIGCRSSTKSSMCFGSCEGEGRGSLEFHRSTRFSIHPRPSMTLCRVRSVGTGFVSMMAVERPSAI